MYLYTRKADLTSYTSRDRSAAQVAHGYMEMCEVRRDTRNNKVLKVRNYRLTFTITVSRRLLTKLVHETSRAKPRVAKLGPFTVSVKERARPKHMEVEYAQS